MVCGVDGRETCLGRWDDPLHSHVVRVRQRPPYTMLRRELMHEGSWL